MTFLESILIWILTSCSAFISLFSLNYTLQAERTDHDQIQLMTSSIQLISKFEKSMTLSTVKSYNSCQSINTSSTVKWVFEACHICDGVSCETFDFPT
ncbi:hypothetical protein J2S04_001715 [Alicyclobacillus tengchongensis]|uniref:Uncharacterized protein n=2 Tax=Alicyclobacillus tolerans TaxID=90970 RepID=A0A1M6XG77_9BACL|nr:hypothetical protein [Alicyclobacillus tengchongensis]SHL04921.1 hypothetical protein SAMN05443507_1342 [Alicyclobacillus montanus]